MSEKKRRGDSTAAPTDKRGLAALLERLKGVDSKKAPIEQKSTEAETNVDADKQIETLNNKKLDDVNSAIYSSSAGPAVARDAVTHFKRLQDRYSVLAKVLSGHEKQAQDFVTNNATNNPEYKNVLNDVDKAKRDLRDFYKFLVSSYNTQAANRIADPKSTLNPAAIKLVKQDPIHDSRDADKEFKKKYGQDGDPKADKILDYDPSDGFEYIIFPEDIKEIGPVEDNLLEYMMLATARHREAQYAKNAKREKNETLAGVADRAYTTSELEKLHGERDVDVLPSMVLKDATYMFGQLLIKMKNEGILREDRANDPKKIYEYLAKTTGVQPPESVRGSRVILKNHPLFNGGKDRRMEFCYNRGYLLLTREELMKCTFENIEPKYGEKGSTKYDERYVNYDILNRPDAKSVHIGVKRVLDLSIKRLMIMLEVHKVTEFEEYAADFVKNAFTSDGLRRALNFETGEVELKIRSENERRKYGQNRFWLGDTEEQRLGHVKTREPDEYAEPIEYIPNFEQLSIPDFEIKSATVDAEGNKTFKSKKESVYETVFINGKNQKAIRVDKLGAALIHDDFIARGRDVDQYSKDIDQSIPVLSNFCVVIKRFLNGYEVCEKEDKFFGMDNPEKFNVMKREGEVASVQQLQNRYYIWTRRHIESILMAMQDGNIIQYSPSVAITLRNEFKGNAEAYLKELDAYLNNNKKVSSALETALDYVTQDANNFSNSVGIPISCNEIVAFPQAEIKKILKDRLSSGSSVDNDIKNETK